MILWNEQQLKELVRRMKLRRTPGQGEPPIHLSLYGPSWDSEPLLTKIMWLDADQWTALGYAETDQVSVTRYLGDLGCRADGAWSAAARHQHPLTPDLATALLDAGACDEYALSCAVQWQLALPLDLAKLLVGVECDPAAQNSSGWDALACLAWGGHPVDPQVTELFLSAGCRADLDGCECVEDEHRLRFGQILKEHAQWKAERLDRECASKSSSCDLNWEQ